MKNLTFSGIDASNEISLIEYGLLVSDQKHEDGSGTQFCIYKMGEGYGSGHFSEKEINNLLLGNEWANEKDLVSFYSFVGSSKNEYLKEPFVNKLSDLIHYFGYDNICGSDYSPMTEKDVRERYL